MFLRGGGGSFQSPQPKVLLATWLPCLRTFFFKIYLLLNYNEAKQNTVSHNSATRSLIKFYRKGPLRRRHRQRRPSPTVYFESNHPSPRCGGRRRYSCLCCFGFFFKKPKPYKFLPPFAFSPSVIDDKGIILMSFLSISVVFSRPLSPLCSAPPHSQTQC